MFHYNKMTDSHKFYKHQDMCFANADLKKDEYNFFVARDLETYTDKNGCLCEGAKEYSFFKNGLDFFQFYSKLQNEEKYYYELLREGTTRYEHYDLENESKDLPTTSQMLNDFFEMCYPNELLRDSAWLISNSSNNKKTSLHLKNCKRVFRNEEEEKMWFESNIKWINNDKYKNFPDKSIYSKNRCMRLLYSSKRGKNRPFIIFDEHNKQVSRRFTDYLISCVSDEDKIKYTESIEVEEEEEYEDAEQQPTTFSRLSNSSKERKIKTLLEYIINGIKNNTIDEFKDSGDGVVCYQDCMKLTTALIYECIVNKIEYNEMVKELVSLYRNVSPKNINKIIESWENSVQKRIDKKEKTTNIRTLYKYAKLGGWKQMTKREWLIMKALSFTHSDIARLFQEETKNAPFISTYEKGDKIHGYQWNKATCLWEERTKGKMITQIEATIVHIYEMYKQQIKNDTQQNDEEDNNNKQIKRIDKLLTNIKCVPYQENIFKAYSNITEDIAFKQKINPITSWEIPIKNNKMLCLKTLGIRERNTNDYWAFEIPRTFNPHTTQTAYEYFFDVMNYNKEKTNTLLQYLGYSISPSLREKLILICIGGADASKTTTMNIYRNVFTDLLISSLSWKVIFTPKNEAVHNEEFMKVKQIRVGIISEPNENCAMNGSSVKAFVGADPLDVRHCGGRLETIINHAKGIILTNKAPKVPADNSLTEKLLYCVLKKHMLNPRKMLRRLKH
jgi:hypothetical protein